MSRLFAGSALLLLTCIPMFAGELIADRDSYVYGGKTFSNGSSPVQPYDANFGAQTVLELKTVASSNDGHTRKIYLGFNLKTLPRTAKSLTLRLTLLEMHAGSGGDAALTSQPLKIYLLKPDAKGDNWIEGAGQIAQLENGTATGSLNWMNAPANAIRMGNKLDPAKVVEAASFSLPATSQKNQVVTIPLNEAVCEALISGLHGPRATLILTVNEGTDDLMLFHSCETANPNRCPALVW